MRGRGKEWSDLEPNTNVWPNTMMSVQHNSISTAHFLRLKPRERGEASLNRGERGRERMAFRKCHCNTDHCLSLFDVKV